MPPPLTPATVYSYDCTTQPQIVYLPLPHDQSVVAIEKLDSTSNTLVVNLLQGDAFESSQPNGGGQVVAYSPSKTLSYRGTVWLERHDNPTPPQTSWRVVNHLHSDDSLAGAIAAASGSGTSLTGAAAAPDSIAAGAITRSGTGAATGFAVVWPDGATGVYAGTESTSFPGAIDAYTVTHVLAGVTKTYTQPLLTRDSSGNVTNRPTITVA